MGSGRVLSRIRRSKKNLKTKCGGEMRQRRAYIDQLESALQIKPCDISEFGRFADLFRVTVVNLKAEIHQEELGNGSLHSLLVRKFSNRPLEMYSRWLAENSR